METETNRNGNFVASRLPWLVAAGMFVLFLVTLNHWLTPISLSRVATITGWDWSQPSGQPLWHVLTYPLRWLPPKSVPIILNLFSVVCATLTLALLARSVALLPHDRTHDQRQREESEFSLLSTRSAWIPPVMAALVCGLQMTFWENAIDGTGEMLDLLIFAYVIRCLLEYRITERESWLFRLAIVYGLGMAENWAMIGFFPGFLAALIWIMGLRFFRSGFLLRMALLGLAGFMLILVLPVAISIKYHEVTGFGTQLLSAFAMEKNFLTHSVPRWDFVLMSLTSILPVFLISIRWASHFGDTSPLGIVLATLSFHFGHLLLMGACIWVALDSTLSPRIRMTGFSFLTLYYLGALSIGYFTGYFLLIFGSTPEMRMRQRPSPLLVWSNRLVTAGVWLLFIAVPAMLLARNLPQIEGIKKVSAAYENYCTQVAAELPARPAIILSDDALPLLYLQATMNRDGKDKGNVYIDTTWFSRSPYYLRFLMKSHPGFGLPEMATNSPTGPPPGLYNVVLWLKQLQNNYELYYLQPSFGYFFEEFCMKPKGMVYQLAHYPSNQWTMPLPTPEQIQANQLFWKGAAGATLTNLRGLVTSHLKSDDPNLWQRFTTALHLERRQNLPAVPLAMIYARALDFWGVELQKCGKLDEARETFEKAAQVSPENVSAGKNLEFNQLLRNGKKAELRLVNTIEDQFGRHGSWDSILKSDGPVDEPNFRLQLAAVFGLGRVYRQAIQEDLRASELLEHPATYVRLAQMFLNIANQPFHTAPSLPIDQCFSNSLYFADRALALSPTNEFAVFFKSATYMNMGKYADAVPLLTQLLENRTTNTPIRLNRAISNFQLERLDAAKADYQRVTELDTNAFQAYYGLGEIAFRQKDIPSAIKYFELYLTNAPPLTREYGVVQAKLEGILPKEH